MSSRLRKLIGLLSILVLCPWPLQAKDEVKLALSMYSSRRAAAIGDLLTVIVDESVSSSKNEALTTSRKSAATAAAPTLGDEDGATLQRLAAKVQLPKYEIAADSEFNGSGTASSSESLTTNFAVRVVDILQNGLLVVRGDRQIQMQKESVTMTLTGLVRPRDVSFENTVLSSRISDAHIHYVSNGEVSRGTRPGWFWKFFQRVNPL